MADNAITKHTCRDGRGPAFGRLTPGCHRCDELAGGAEPRQTSHRRADGDAAQFERNRAHHFAPGGPHQTRCAGQVCTFGDW